MACGDDPSGMFGYTVAPSAWGTPAAANNCAYRWREPTYSARRAAIQDFLKRLNRYDGPIDGIWGPNTIKGIQESCTEAGTYTGPEDGEPGAQTLIGVGNYALFNVYVPDFPQSEIIFWTYYHFFDAEFFGHDIWHWFYIRLYNATLEA